MLLFAARLLLPDAAAALRLRAMEALHYHDDHIAALKQLGERLDLGERQPPNEGNAAIMTVPVIAPRTIYPYYCSFYTDEAVSAGERLPYLPAAVTAFLESQAAFADEALPENVDYRYCELPFDYAVPVSGRNSSGFGYRLHPILNIVRFHFGTDFAAGTGAAVQAFADGTVTFSGYDESFGYHLMLDHGAGWQSHYCHCSALYADAGEKVSRGETVALVGATGLATGPHLHFELTRDGVYLNPEYYINQ